MSTQKVILKFKTFSEQSAQEGAFLKRITGFVEGKRLIPLINQLDLQANPRSAKHGPITKAIIDSLRNTVEIFPFKTKGILLASSSVKFLDKKRFELLFEKDNLEGILDGGHNMMAIAIFMLESAQVDESSIKKIKKWTNLRGIWDKYGDEVDEIKNDFSFLVPVEIIMPICDDAIALETFESSIDEICSARNNNAELKLETKSHKKGFYDDIKNNLDTKICDSVEWKTNAGGRIKSPDIIALSWIPLSKLPSEYHISSIVPTCFHARKQVYVDAFDKLMKDSNVGKEKAGKYELQNNLIYSAFVLMKDIPKIYDTIYEEFPNVYEGKFGRISDVKMYKKNEKPTKDKYLKKPPLTKYLQKEVTYKYSDGFINPLVYALQELIEIKENSFVWSVDPLKFIEDNLEKIVADYKGVLESLNFDPSRVGKSAHSYSVAKNLFQNCLMKSKLPDSGSSGS